MQFTENVFTAKKVTLKKAVSKYPKALNMSQ